MTITFDRHPGSAATTQRSRGGRTRTVTKSLAARTYLPVCFLTAGAAALIAIGWISHWGGANFTGTLFSLRVSVIGPATLVIIAILMIAERVWPAQQRSPVARGYRQDALYTILNSTLTLPLIAALSLSFSAVVRSRLPWLTFPRIAALPHLLVVGAILVAMDGCNWAAHLANHRSNVLWRFHEVHHSQEDMSVLTVFRTHPFVHIVYTVALIPGIVLLANGGLSTGLLIAYAGSVALAHSNIRLSFGPVLGRIFVSPNFHRIHHRLEGRQDVNLGFALTIWDQMFKTAVFPTKETVGIATGLPGRTLIVEQEGVRPHHFKVFIAQLLAPWRPMSAEARATPLNADEPIEMRASCQAP
jgi:sterol desaturase/sphingolipid hydroxylase (fatty acid hydroxylase superfamily)